MDPTTFGVLLSMFGGAISVLFWALIRDKDKQIDALEKDNTELKAEITKLNDVVRRNTDALAQNATSQEAVVTMLTDLLGPASPTSKPTAPR